MGKTFFFENIKILRGPNKDVYKDSLLIVNGKIKAFGEEAKKEAFEQNIAHSESADKLVAPLLVDSHSILNNPLTGINDDLENLKLRAKRQDLDQSPYFQIVKIGEINLKKYLSKKLAILISMYIFGAVLV